MNLPTPRPEDWLELTRPGHVTVHHAGLLTYGDEAIQILDQASSNGKSVVFFSLGRSERSVAADLLCRRAGIRLGEGGPKVFSPGEVERLKGLGEQIWQERIAIHDNADLTLDQLEEVLAEGGDTDFVIIDSMELMDSPMRHEGRVQGFAKLVGSLRRLARRRSVAILAIRRPQYFR
ncbi:MAG: DnaB-like helicase C-terminal domain-containing protein [Planctomycetota bacterium]